MRIFLCKRKLKDQGLVSWSQEFIIHLAQRPVLEEELLNLLPVLPDDTFLFRHFLEVCGHASQHTGGASALSTAYTHEVTGPHEASC
mgnify:CR=1 FL=1